MLMMIRLFFAPPSLCLHFEPRQAIGLRGETGMRKEKASFKDTSSSRATFSGASTCKLISDISPFFRESLGIRRLPQTL